MNQTVWQIRYLRESQYRSESETIIAQASNKADILKLWVDGGYEKSSKEMPEETFGLFKVTFERIDNV